MKKIKMKHEYETIGGHKVKLSSIGNQRLMRYTTEGEFESFNGTLENVVWDEYGRYFSEIHSSDYDLARVKKRKKKRKTTGMNFSQALKQLKLGRSVKRKDWQSGILSLSKNNTVILMAASSNLTHTYIISSNLLANDWEIVE